MNHYPTGDTFRAWSEEIGGHPMTHTVTLHFHTEPLLMRVVRRQTAAAAAALGATAASAGRIEVAVGEALANAHDHGYGGAPGPVELEIAFEGDLFGVTIYDAGRGLLDVPHFPAAPDSRRNSGWGLKVIKELMDEAVLRPGPKGVGTTLRMSVRLGREAEANQRGEDYFRREPWWQ